MIWKRLPYWLRGGIIGTVIAVIYLLLLSSCGLLPGYWPIGCWAFVYLFGPIYPVMWSMVFIENFFNYHGIDPAIYAPYVNIPACFVLGSLFGALVWRIKSKKKAPRFSASSERN